MPVAPYAATRVREAPTDTTQVNVRTTADSFVPDISPAAKLFERIAFEEKTKLDDNRALEADSELIKLASDLKYNKDTGYINRRGRDAETVVDDTLGQYDKAVDALDLGLTNPEQHEKFRERVRQRRSAFDGELQKYSYDERERYVAETQDAYMANESTAAIQGAAGLASTDNVLAGQARDGIRASLARQTDLLAKETVRQGKSIDWYRQEVLKVTSKVHSGVLDTLMEAGDSDVIGKYFEANRDAMLPADAERAAKAVAVSTLRGKAQNTFDEIVDSGKDIEAQLAKANKIKDPEVRDDVYRRLQDKMRLDNALEREKNEDTFLAAVNSVEKVGDVSAVRPSVWSTLDINQRNALHAMVDRRREGALAGKEGGESNTEAWLKFLDMPAAEKARLTPAQFQTQFRPLLGDAEFKRATTEWNAAREAARSPKPGALSNMQSDTDIVKGAYTLGIAKPADKWDSDEKLGYIKFNDEVARQVNDLEVKKGEKASVGEKQKIANGLMTKVRIKTSFFPDPSVLVTDVDPADVAKAYTPMADIPQGDVNALTNLLRSYGVAGKVESTTVLRERLADRIERAHAAIQLGQPRSVVTSILKGAPR